MVVANEVEEFIIPPFADVETDIIVHDVHEQLVGFRWVLWNDNFEVYTFIDVFINHAIKQNKTVLILYRVLKPASWILRKMRETTFALYVAAKHCKNSILKVSLNSLGLHTYQL